jgi:deazaflavin-dependent oxidoreductase (nitroreductase family)
MRRVAKAIAVVLGVGVLVIVIDQIVESMLMLLAFRTDSPTAKRLLTSYHKHVTNPVMVRFFSGRSKHAALIEHVGRNSGTTYQTPVTAHRAEDTIIVPLPYGTEIDWLRNLQAAGDGIVKLENRSFTVLDPEVVPVERIIPLLPPYVTRIVRMHDTKHALVLHLAKAAERMPA